MNLNKIPIAYTFDDLNLVPGSSEIQSRSDVDLSSEIVPGVKVNIPIIAANMSTICEIEMLRAMVKCGGSGVLHRFMSIQKNIDYLNGVTVPSGDYNYPIKKIGLAVGIKDYMDVLFCLYNEEIDYGENYLSALGYIVVDIAHGHMVRVAEAVKEIKSKYPFLKVVAGNVCTYVGASDLICAGADAVKVGVGPGSVCTTRVQTGCGVPQLTAISEVSRAIEHSGKDVRLIADGGIRTSGDIVKAIAMGADSVMVGGMISGTFECPGEVVEHEGKKFKKYSGMASSDAQSIFFGTEKEKVASEGISELVKCKGSVSDIIKLTAKRVQSGFSYCGCKNIKEMQLFGSYTDNWVQITPAGRIESTCHIRID